MQDACKKHSVRSLKSTKRLQCLESVTGFHVILQDSVLLRLVYLRSVFILLNAEWKLCLRRLVHTMNQANPHVRVEFYEWILGIYNKTQPFPDLIVVG
jgi:hypothetical protein